MEKLVQSSSFT